MSTVILQNDLTRNSSNRCYQYFIFYTKTIAMSSPQYSHEEAFLCLCTYIWEVRGKLKE